MDVTRLIKYVKEHEGAPYVHQGRGEGGYDCVGLIDCALKDHGIAVAVPANYTRYPTGDRLTRAIEDSGLVYPREMPDPEAGDLLLFRLQSEPHHVGIYMGEGQFIHATITGDQVRLAHLGSYWKARLFKCYGWVNG